MSTATRWETSCFRLLRVFWLKPLEKAIWLPVSAAKNSILLPNTSLKAALIGAERTRKKFVERRFTSDATLFGSSVSVGISQLGGHAELADLLVQADAALYAAKRSGRNRVVLYSDRSSLSLLPTGLPIDPIKVDMSPTPDQSALYKAVADTARRHSARKGRLTRRV
jgi:Diguanylate cyclase, GGDEF domain